MILILRLPGGAFACLEALVALMAAYSICRKAVLRVGKIATQLRPTAWYEQVF